MEGTAKHWQRVVCWATPESLGVLGLAWVLRTDSGNALARLWWRAVRVETDASRPCQRRPGPGPVAPNPGAVRVMTAMPPVRSHAKSPGPVPEDPQPSGRSLVEDSRGAWIKRSGQAPLLRRPISLRLASGRPAASRCCLADTLPRAQGLPLSLVRSGTSVARCSLAITLQVSSPPETGLIDSMRRLGATATQLTATTVTGVGRRGLAITEPHSLGRVRA